MPKGIYNRKTQPAKRSPKKNKPAKRKYTKKSDKWTWKNSVKDSDKPDVWIYDADFEAQGDNQLNVQIQPEKSFKDELDLLRDMMSAFEAMNDDSRYRAYAYFKNKHSQYDLDLILA